ncbi:MAG: succinate dehydrogenase assembly factor 2 [Methylophilaceae bacterium]|nr:MAG: succinate dehydrogenase assembly factor 2 [Methylophilaceae bacterium]
MINAEIMLDAEQRRLAWRCRRGMLELDIVLQRFVNEQFNDLSLKEFEVFDGLLDLPDNEFWALIQSQKAQNNQHLNNIITKLNAVSSYVLRDF